MRIANRRRRRPLQPWWLGFWFAALGTLYSALWLIGALAPKPGIMTYIFMTMIFGLYAAAALVLWDNIRHRPGTPGQDKTNERS